MTYTIRPATPQDADAIAPLWQAFAQDRTQKDPSLAIKPDFDFVAYIHHQLSKPLTFGWALEQEGAIVGCLLVYFYDEAPPSSLPEEMRVEYELNTPFQSRRVGSVLGLYVQPEHRYPDAIQQLTDAAFQKASELHVSDIDILVGADQTGVQALLKRSGFSHTAVQYTKHYPLATNAELPSLHPPRPELPEFEPPQPSALPLRDPKTNELIENPAGEPVFLMPLRNEAGELVKNSRDLPIYPTPLRDPQTQAFVFDGQGQLVTCPVLRDESGQILEHKGMVCFQPPEHDFVNGKLQLRRNGIGSFVFREAERDNEGKVMCSPSGQPVFKITRKS